VRGGEKERRGAYSVRERAQICHLEKHMITICMVNCPKGKCNIEVSKNVMKCEADFTAGPNMSLILV